MASQTIKPLVKLLQSYLAKKNQVFFGKLTDPSEKLQTSCLFSFWEVITKVLLSGFYDWVGGCTVLKRAFYSVYFGLFNLAIYSHDWLDLGISRWAIVTLTHSFQMHPFSTPWKHRKTLTITVFSCFQGEEKGCIGNEWVTKFSYFMVYIIKSLFQCSSRLISRQFLTSCGVD